MIKLKFNTNVYAAILGIVICSCHTLAGEKDMKSGFFNKSKVEIKKPEFLNKETPLTTSKTEENSFIENFKKLEISEKEEPKKEFVKKVNEDFGKKPVVWNIPFRLKQNLRGIDIELPFQYKDLSKEDFTLLPERFCTVIRSGENKYALIGPLRPCVGIVLECGGTVVAAHSHYSSNTESLAAIAIAAFESEGKTILEIQESFRGLLFTNILKIQDNITQEVIDRLTELHKSKSQIDHLQFLRRELLDCFGLDPENKEHKSKIKTYQPWDSDVKIIGDYRDSSLYLAVSSGPINPYSAVSAEEDTFGLNHKLANLVNLKEGEYAGADLNTKHNVISAYITNYFTDMTAKYFDAYHDHPDAHVYNDIVFEKI